MYICGAREINDEKKTIVKGENKLLKEAEWGSDPFVHLLFVSHVCSL